MARKIVYSIGSIVSLIFIVLSCILTYQMGILSDELSISGNFGLGLWIVLFVCLISFIICLYLLFSKSKLISNKQTVFYIITAVLIALSAALIVINYNNIQNKNSEYTEKYGLSLLSYSTYINA